MNSILLPRLMLNSHRVCPTTAVHVDCAINVNRHGVIRSRVRNVDDVARGGRGLIFARPEHMATRLGDFNGLFACLSKRQNLCISRHLCLDTGHGRRRHECACYGGDTQQTRQRSAHPHLLLLHRSAHLAPMLSRCPISLGAAGMVLRQPPAQIDIYIHLVLCNRMF